MAADDIDPEELDDVEIDAVKIGMLSQVATIEAVAAGLGALMTWRARGFWTMWKSWRSVPSRDMAWARTPAPDRKSVV